MMLALPLLIGLAAALAAGFVVRIAGRHAAWLLALAPASIFALVAAEMPVGEPLAETWRWVPSLGIDIQLRLDGVALLFCLMISGIGTLVVIYAGAYFAERPVAQRARFLTLILLFMTAMLGTVLSDNLVVMFLFWEGTSVISFLLVGFDQGSATARRSAQQALLVTGGGGLALLGGIALIGTEFGTYSLTALVARAPEVAASPMAPAIATAILLGAFTKSAQYPFYFWLPNAMQAPTPASAYLHSATMVKLGIYLMARFEYLLSPLPGYRSVLVTVGGLTMLVAAVQALRAEGFKAALAYSTVASLGILTVLVGLDGPVASVALVGFLLAHALYKATLFFVAGNILHATGEGRLRRLGGLARFLPGTAVAAVLASLSMAGLPPFFGFVSKELLFEAQIESSWEYVPIAIAVVVNAVMVAVAGLVSLRPFFLSPERQAEVKHGDTPGLLLGPLVLAATGALLSLRPEWLTRTIIEPAVRDLLHQRVDVSVSLWHGFTPMLALSGLVFVAGALIWTFWRPIHLGLNSLRVIDRISGDALYDRGMAATLGFAGFATRMLQHGDLRGYLATTALALVALTGWMLARAGTLPALDLSGGVQPVAAGLLVIAAAAAFAATRSRSTVSGLVAVGLVGFAVALLFLANGAPDLALTQFSVEALLVVLLTAFVLPLPLATLPTRSSGERRRDLALAAAFGAIIFVGLQGVTGQPFDASLSEAYGRLSLPEGFGRNVVNVILVDFRALDTLGETAVIATATLAVWALFRTASPRPVSVDGPARTPSPFVLAVEGRPLFWFILAMSVLILLRGHNEPGGGFVGGLVAALAFAILTLAEGAERAGRVLRVHPMALAGTGLAIAFASGLAPGRPYLDHSWATVAGLKLGTTIAFDIGVYLAVLGGVTAMLRRAYREGAR